jgi:hypothetical protein
MTSWPLVASACPDLFDADGLARLQLVARRAGGSIHLRDVSAELVELLDLLGLREVLIGAALRQMGGEAEDLEQGSVDEVVVPDDPVA